VRLLFTPNPTHPMPPPLHTTHHPAQCAATRSNNPPNAKGSRQAGGERGARSAADDKPQLDNTAVLLNVLSVSKRPDPPCRASVELEAEWGARTSDHQYLIILEWSGQDGSLSTPIASCRASVELEAERGARSAAEDVVSGLRRQLGEVRAAEEAARAAAANTLALLEAEVSALKVPAPISKDAAATPVQLLQWGLRRAAAASTIGFTVLPCRGHTLQRNGSLDQIRDAFVFPLLTRRKINRSWSFGAPMVQMKRRRLAANW